MRKRVACKQDQNCDTWNPKPQVENCGPGKDCIGVMHPNGSSKPLAEMLYEAYLYYSGQNVQYGTRSAVDPTIDFDSIRESIANPDASTGSKYYDKPAAANCQNNYIIMLTDGISQQDSSSNTDIQKLVESLPQDVLKSGGYTVNKNGSVTYPINSWASNGKAPSEYIDDLAFYLRWARPSYAPKLPATGVTTYTVGFNLSSLSDQDAKDATQLLNDIAKQGGTESAVLAESASSLRGLLDGIVTKILATSTSFSAPSVTINAFNRTQNLNDLYMAVFRPEYLRRWKGNVKKYNVVSDPVTLASTIVDASGSAAVDEISGNFLPLSESLWSASGFDGTFAPEGGAASRLLPPSDRKILVDNDDSDLESLKSYVASLSTTDKRAIFDLGTSASDTAIDDLTGNLVDWLYGVDVYDESPIGPDPDRDGLFNDGDSNTIAQKWLIGDPLHSRPAVVVYGRDKDEKDAVVYITTNEGLLHAIDARDSDDTDGNGGQELWAFAPRELLDRLDFLRNRADKVELKDRTDQRLYGIDGTVKVLRIDRDRDGPIESSRGDRVFLFFGLRRGGSAYYGIDVTDPSNPELMWRTDLADGAQSWSNPTVGEWVRVNIKSANYGTRVSSTANPSDPSTMNSATVFNNSDPDNRFVIVVGGGFDASNDGMTYKPDSKGNKILMLDAVSGEILWSGGATDSGASEEFEQMNNSIVADVRVLDLSGDLYADRMYAADLGGQVWRFDITNGNAASSLVEGGVMASVGGAANSLKDRRFYYAPDVAEVRCGGKVFYNVAIGSGDRENPVSDKTTRNAFFSFRDYLTRTPVKSADYKSDCSNTTDRPCFETILDDSELVDVTTTANATVGPDATGWKMDLVAVGSSGGTPTVTGRGEKALAESRTFANNVYFTTYSPELRKQGDCGNEVGVNRLYVVSACNAAPVNNYDGQVGSTSIADRSLTLAQGSIAPEVVFIFPTPPKGCTTKDCMPLPQCLIGLESCGNGLPNRPKRVFWREKGAE
jgi:type IV pilus assembly protein PilY1